MNPIFLDLGTIKIYWYTIIIFLGFLLGGTLALKNAKKENISEDFITNYFFYLIPIAIIGARLYYVLFNLDYYSNNLLDIFKIWEGGLAIHGGVIASLIFTIYYTKKYSIDTFKILDIMVVSLILGQAIGRWGNFMNNEAYGPVTTLETLKNLHIPQFIIDGMHINGNYYHPTFLYESLWCLIGFLILLFMKKSRAFKKGSTFSTYLIWYGIGRFLIESLRQDSLYFGTLRVAQLVSILGIIIGVIILVKNREK